MVFMAILCLSFFFPVNASGKIKFSIDDLLKQEDLKGNRWINNIGFLQTDFVTGILFPYLQRKFICNRDYAKNIKFFCQLRLVNKGWKELVEKNIDMAEYMTKIMKDRRQRFRSLLLLFFSNEFSTTTNCMMRFHHNNIIEIILDRLLFMKRKTVLKRTGWKINKTKEMYIKKYRHRRGSLAILPPYLEGRNSKDTRENVQIFLKNSRWLNALINKLYSNLFLLYFNLRPYSRISQDGLTTSVINSFFGKLFFVRTEYKDHKKTVVPYFEWQRGKVVVFQRDSDHSTIQFPYDYIIDIFDDRIGGEHEPFAGNNTPKAIVDCLYDYFEKPECMCVFIRNTDRDKSIREQFEYPAIQ